MTNSKYDQNNYLKHLAIPVITDNQKINQLFGSYLLRIKWWHVDRLKLNLSGILRIHTNTPFGLLKPQDYRLGIDNNKAIYIQFLALPNPEFEYQIEVIHPPELNRSMLEIWEYIPPQIYDPNATMPVYGQDDTATNALIAATVANTAAINAMASANPSADAIADAIANNSVITLPAEVKAVGSSLVSLVVKSLLTRTVTIKNVSSSKIKIWIGDTLPTIPAGLPGAGGAIIYATTGETVELAANNGVYEVPDSLCKSGIYAIANNANGSVSVTRTYTN
jgi:hypothetical protein